MRPFKSRAQISRKQLESIPLLKNLRISNDKLSIFKSAKNEYNIFVKGQPKDSYNDQILVVNGEAKSNHDRSSSKTPHKIERGLTFDSWKSRSLTMFGRNSATGNYFTSPLEGSHPHFNVAGRRKSL